MGTSRAPYLSGHWRTDGELSHFTIPSLPIPGDLIGLAAEEAPWNITGGRLRAYEGEHIRQDSLEVRVHLLVSHGMDAVPESR